MTLIKGLKRQINTALIGAILLLVFTSCLPLPYDPGKTYEKLLGGQPLRVGVLVAPPFVVSHEDSVSGTEVDLVKEFAQSRKISKLQFSVFSVTDGFDALKNKKIDVLIGGLKKDMPFESVGYTRAFDHNRVLALQQGENRFLVELEAFLGEKFGDSK